MSTNADFTKRKIIPFFREKKKRAEVKTLEEIKTKPEVRISITGS